MRVLTVNAGSSSLRLRVLDGETVLDDPPDLDRAVEAVRRLGVEAVGHRVVHGGRTVQAPTLVDSPVVAALRELTGLAPLHQPRALAAVERLAEALPGVPQVVCPDTAFHATLPPAVTTPAVPAAWRRRFGLRRYGFHGLSVAWAVRRLSGESAPAPRRLVVAHLGAGASLTAVLDGRSLDTTMGFTPLDGLVMATRSGTLDPGAVLWLVQQGLAPEDVVHDLETRSGLLALSGTPDMAEVVRRRAAGDPDAALAFDVYVHRLRGLLAQMVAALSGLDALVLTGGVGERSPVVRQAAVDGLAWLGVRLDAEANDKAVEVHDLADIAAATSTARALVLHAREDLEIARGIHQALQRH